MALKKLPIVWKYQSSQPALMLLLVSKFPKNILEEDHKACEPVLHMSNSICFFPLCLEPAPAPLPPGPRAELLSRC